MNQGWIKLHRCLLDDVVCQRSADFHLWVVLLLKAGHKKREFIFNGQMHRLDPGQLITGRKKLSQQTGIPESTVERILKRLESGQKIRQEIFKKYRVIGIVNWENFQSTANGELAGGPITDRPRTDREPNADTNKNDKKGKNEKKKAGPLSFEQMDIQQAETATGAAKAAFLKDK